MSGKIAIVGAGLIGRLIACRLLAHDVSITLFDRDSYAGAQSCAAAGAGMLAPYSELELSEPPLFLLARESLDLWKSFLSQLSMPVFFQQEGTLIVAHPHDQALLDRLPERILKKLRQIDQGLEMPIEKAEASRVAALEPSLAGRFDSAWYIAREGQIDNRQLMTALRITLSDSKQVDWRAETEVTSTGENTLVADGRKHNFDMVIDCRGLGARADIAGLRGVRGELIDLLAPRVTLNRPVRLMHPRYPLYVVPRQQGRYLIGASSIESDDSSPITVQSTMELLSAAFVVDPGFADASIIETRVNCRPALTDNLPAVSAHPGLIRVNGLYRHGFLVGPKVADLVCRFITDQKSAVADPCFALLSNKEKPAYAGYSQ